MIRVNIPGFFDSDSGGPRWGDCQIVNNSDIIDGYCGVGATRLIKRLKKLKVNNPYLHITHAHYDHYNGIERIIDDSYFTPKALYCYDPKSLNANFSKDCAENVAALTRIVNKAKKKGIPVIFLKDGDKIVHGDVKITVYRIQPKTAENTDSYINDGSLCYWFPDLRYLTTGDGPDKVFELCQQKGIRPVFFKISHHGNNCNRTQANGMKSLGAIYCWDNDYNLNITDFLQYGRKRCIEAGIKYFNIHGDINFVAYGKKVVIYKDGKNYQYACSYNGKSTLKMADLTVVADTISGKYGSDETRVTNLLDAGYYPSNVQNWINKLYRLIKG